MTHTIIAALVIFAGCALAFWWALASGAGSGDEEDDIVG